MIASRIAVSVSGRVAPVAMQPGRSGTYAEKLRWLPSGRNQEPAVVVKQAEQITHFHPPTLRSGFFSGNV